MEQKNIEDSTPVEKEAFYWHSQISALACLFNIGLRFTLKDRLSLFEIYHTIQKMYDEKKIEWKLLDEATESVERLIWARVNGYEPPHDGEQYK